MDQKKELTRKINIDIKELQREIKNKQALKKFINQLTPYKSLVLYKDHIMQYESMGKYAGVFRAFISKNEKSSYFPLAIIPISHLIQGNAEIIRPADLPCYFGWHILNIEALQAYIDKYLKP